MTLEPKDAVAVVDSVVANAAREERERIVAEATSMGASCPGVTDYDKGYQDACDEILRRIGESE